jgi:putative addiction module component (TIGR02574 family)
MELKMEAMQKSEIIKTILSLPINERLEIIERISIGLPQEDYSDIEKEWVKEADRRVDTFLSGEMTTISAEEIYKKSYNN